MPITRPGETPSFYKYSISYALTSSKMPKETWPELVKEYDPMPIIIPPYQRKIVWKKNEVKEFIESSSTLFGTVILASDGTDSPIILLDGLQRFATATAVINILYPLVLSPEPTLPNHADKFRLLKASISNFQPIFEHNDKMLREYSRKGISSSYIQLFNSIKSYINEELEKRPEEFSSKIKSTFMTKQIAIDTYFGFKNRSELTHTFININSTGIDLSEVDLLRSEIIQQADQMRWNDDEIDQLENSFTEVFQSGLIKGAKVLGKNLYDALDIDPVKVFKNWNSLEKSQVDDLLNFVTSIYNASMKEDDEGKKIHPYLYEIFQCGDLPFALTVWYFYKFVHLEGKNPDFLGGDYDTKSSRHLLLRAFYRRIIDGSIGRIGPIVTNFILEKDSPPITTIHKLAFKINQDTGAGSLDSSPNEGWISQGLRKSGTNRARRIFNACLLPNRTDEGGDFTPIEYGTKKNQWNIDHLIPKVKTILNKTGEDEMDEIHNFAPLPSELNMKAKDYPCERKLKPDELYSTVKSRHPYLEWLCTEHYEEFKDKIEGGVHLFNSQDCLVVNATTPIGDKRIEEIKKLLKNKL